MRLIQRPVLALSCLLVVALCTTVVSQEEYSSADTDWETFLQAAELNEQGDVDEAIEILEGHIVDKQTPKTIVEEARRYLAQIYLNNNRPKEAVEILTELLLEPMHPLEKYGLYLERATAYDQLGDHVLAEADRQSAHEVSGRNPQFNFEHLTGQPTLPLRERIDRRLQEFFPELSSTTLGKSLITISCGIAFWLIVFCWDLWRGNRQRIEGEGTWRRLMGVSAAMSLFQTLPMQIFLACFLLLPEEVELGTAFQVALVTTILSTFWVGLYLIPALRWVGTKDPLQKVDDVDFLLRLEKMSTELGIRTPVARMLPSSGGSMMIQAFAGGLPQPSLTLSDGVLMRLEEHEVDAIVGHELGHIANKSLWCFPITAALAWATPVLVSFVFGFWTSLFFGMAVFSGLSRIVSRYFEYDSDKKAAQVAGTSATVTALDKTHIASMVNNQGWASFLAYSMATHPSQEERLSALAQNAPTSDQPEITWSLEAAKKRRWGARIVFLCWLSILISCFFLPSTGPWHEAWSFARGIVLVTIFILPQLILQKAIRKEVRSEMKRRQVTKKSHFGWILLITILLVFSVYGWQDAMDESSVEMNNSPETGFFSWPFWISVAVLSVLFLLWGKWKAARSPVAQIRLAFHQKRWADAVELGRVNWEKLKPNAAVRNDLVLALWMTGEEDRAIGAMKQLQKDFPTFKHPWVVEALMHLDRSEYQTALDVLNEVKRDLKDDLGRLGIVARCSWFLGDYETMEETANQMESISPNLAAVQSFRFLGALENGDVESAREHLKQAEYFAPGDAYIELLKAKYELRFGDHDAALKSLAAARVLINASPFSFLGAELRHVEEMIQPVSDVAEVLPETEEGQNDV